VRPLFLRIFFVFLGSLVGFQAMALSGTWKFTEIIYKGQRQPLLNPDLNLQWTFFSNGTDRLYWDRKGIAGFCERFANYKVLTDEEGQQTLDEEVFAANPKNMFECARDADMQPGRKTSNLIDISKKEILVHFNLGDDEIVYVLTPFSP